MLLFLISGTKHFLLMCNVKAEDAGEIRFVSGDVESTAYLEVEGTTAVTVLSLCGVGF